MALERRLYKVERYQHPHTTAYSTERVSAVRVHACVPFACERERERASARASERRACVRECVDAVRASVCVHAALKCAFACADALVRVREHACVHTRTLACVRSLRLR